ncbi:hypothetical protein KUCAC02_020038, partial [Chaenocephalus aceratus]
AGCWARFQVLHFDAEDFEDRVWSIKEMGDWAEPQLSILKGGRRVKVCGVTVHCDQEDS